MKSLIALESEDMDVHVCEARILTIGLSSFVNTACVGLDDDDVRLRIFQI